VFAFVQDGDIAQMYIRNDILSDTALQSEFKLNMAMTSQHPDI